MLTGALNGSAVFLRVKTGSQWLTIGGQLSHTATQSNTPIDITCKQQGHSFRELLDTEGLKTFDVSGQLIFSTDAAFDYVKTASANQSIETFQIVRGTIGAATDDVMEFKAKVTSWSEASPDNDKTTADITLTSSEEWEDGLQFEQFFSSGGEEFLTSDGDKVYVRV